MRRKPVESYHHGDLRAALVSAGLQILKKEGLEALSLREVARQAGVSHQAPYHHFPTRGHLMAAIAAEGFEKLSEALETIQEGAENPIDAAQRTGVRYVTFAAENPERFKLMFGGAIGSREPYPELDAAARRVFTLLVRPFGLAANEKRGPNPVVLTLWSTVHGLAALAVDGQIAFKGKELEAAALATTERVWLGVKDALTR
jgi:AcrR family transcriptional regulator